MNKKRWIIIFFSPLLLSLIVSEVFVYINKDKNRHIVDYKINTIIPNSTNKGYDYILLGDSLLDNAVGNIKLNKNVLDLSTSAYITLPGNYFLLKRYLETAIKKPKAIYLFLVPNILNKLSNGNKDLYYRTVFNNKSEVSMINKIEKSRNAESFFIQYFLSRKRAFFKNYYSPKKRYYYKTISNPESFIIKSDYNKKKVNQEIKQSKYAMNNIDISVHFALENIKKLSLLNNINLYFILEPLPKEINKEFKLSKLKKLLEENQYKIININNYYTFDNYLFKDDGIHIKGDVNSYYTYLIDKYVVNIF